MSDFEREQQDARAYIQLKRKINLKLREMGVSAESVEVAAGGYYVPVGVMAKLLDVNTED